MVEERGWTADSAAAFAVVVVVPAVVAAVGALRPAARVKDTRQFVNQVQSDSSNMARLTVGTPLY